MSFLSASARRFPSAGRVPAAALLAVLLLASSSAQARAMYRWVDGSGAAHYSDTPTPGAEKVWLPDPVTPGTQTNPRDGSPEEAVEPGDGQDAGLVAAAARACAERKKKLQAYLDAARIIETDAFGNKRVYSAQEREALVERTREDVRGVCSR